MEECSAAPCYKKVIRKNLFTEKKKKKFYLFNQFKVTYKEVTRTCLCIRTTNIVNGGNRWSKKRFKDLSLPIPLSLPAII